MITVSQLRKKAERKYWAILRAQLTGEPEFPLSIPADKSLPESFEELRRTVGDLVKHSKEQKTNSYRLTFEFRKTRKLGNQSVPTGIVFDTAGDFLTFIGKKGEAAKILHAAETLRDRFPELTGWVERNPKTIHKYQEKWPDLIEVLRYFKSNPRPGKYIRELPVKVHTKFIQQNKGIVGELLEQVIPEEINWGGETFEQRFHLRAAEPLIRFRRLDGAQDGAIFALSEELALPAEVFSRLEIRSRKVVITENLMTYLTLPPLKNTIAIYGGGFNVRTIRDAEWLKSKTVIYWGDIDAHGFLILSMLRQYYPETRSVMMDEETFHRYRGNVGTGAEPGETDADKLNLTTAEKVLFRQVHELNYRLEQEHIPADYASVKLILATEERKREKGDNQE